jgi:hypothetical protein
LIDNMSRRVAEVIRVKGSHTEYHNYRDCVDQNESQKSVPMSHPIKMTISSHDVICFPRYMEQI